MKRITFAIATALILGAHTLSLPKFKPDVKASLLAEPAASLGDACKNLVQIYEPAQ